MIYPNFTYPTNFVAQPNTRTPEDHSLNKLKLILSEDTSTYVSFSGPMIF